MTMTLATKLSIVRFMLACGLMLAPGLTLSAGPAEPADDQSAFEIHPASITPFATRSMMLDVTRAGERIVAVGDRGVILLSDDEGQSWRQPAVVPVNATLNAVSFADALTGWAVGHWGVILRTVDGGETWTRQRIDTSEDRPLFSVHFSDARNGIAVGLWSLLLRTNDGGETWEDVALAAPPGDTRADRNLMRIFADTRGILFIVGERGTVLRSTDQGQSWDYRETDYHGSFWTGVALPDDTLLVAGLRGNLYRSLDSGDTWVAAQSTTHSSITHIVSFDTRVLAVALDGVSLESLDGGATFVAHQRDDRIALTAAAPLNDGRVIIFSRTGVLGD